jgi:charged multivesicular body protein 1
MSTKALEKNLFNLKWTTKQLQSNARKCAKEEASEKLKVKKAIEQGNAETARIYAENVIRKKHEHLNYLRLAARIDAVASRVQSAVTMKKVTSSMTSVVKNMDKALESMNMEKISQVMEEFERQFEDLDIQSQFTEQAIAQSSSIATPEDQVKELMQQVADEHQLQLTQDMISAKSANSIVTVSANSSNNQKNEADLNERLAKLRNA